MNLWKLDAIFLCLFKYCVHNLIITILIFTFCFYVFFISCIFSIDCLYNFFLPHISCFFNSVHYFFIYSFFVFRGKFARAVNPRYFLVLLTFCLFPLFYSNLYLSTFLHNHFVFYSFYFF